MLTAPSLDDCLQARAAHKKQPQQQECDIVRYRDEFWYYELQPILMATD